MATLLEVQIHLAVDDDPDLSCLGEFVSSADPAEVQRGSIYDRGPATSRREHRYIVPGVSLDEHKKNLSHWGYSRGVTDQKAREYVRRDCRRLESYGDTWHMVGVMARATIEHDSGLVIHVDSPGCWGVESDCDRDFIVEIFQDEAAALREQLQELAGLDLADFDELAQEAA